MASKPASPVGGPTQVGQSGPQRCIAARGQLLHVRKLSFRSYLGGAGGGCGNLTVSRYTPSKSAYCS